MSLDAQIDDLYRSPLADFTRARNALVKTVRGADASRVRTLAKPTVVAWAVNQVYWRSRAVYERLMKAGEKLRQAQIAALTGKETDVRDSSATHRKALADAVKEAEQIASSSGSHPALDALMRTFEALSLAKDPPAQPGRLVDALQPAGFEALAGVTPNAPLTAARAPAVKKPDTTGGPRVRLQADRNERKRAEEEKRRAAEVKKAEAVLERARAKMRAAEEALRRTQGRS